MLYYKVLFSTLQMAFGMMSKKAVTTANLAVSRNLYKVLTSTLAGLIVN